MNRKIEEMPIWFFLGCGRNQQPKVSFVKCDVEFNKVIGDVGQVLYIDEDCNVVDEYGKNVAIGYKATDVYGRLILDGDYETHIVMSLGDVLERARWGSNVYLDAMLDADIDNEDVIKHLVENGYIE